MYLTQTKSKFLGWVTIGKDDTRAKAEEDLDRIFRSSVPRKRENFRIVQFDPNDAVFS